MQASFNHAYIQINLGVIFKEMDKYSVFGELTLTIEGKDYITDIAVYPKLSINYHRDIIKVTDMPLLIVEILSPTQGMQEIIDKFAVYFNAGVKSCWLVQPYGQSVMVWKSPDESKHFVEGEISDQVLGLNIPVHKVFE